MPDGDKVLVIGLDGAAWNIIQPMVQKGKLPTIENLMNNGCFGDLESCLPPATFPAWKCYSTGKNPGKLGVYWFFDPDFEKNDMVVHNSTSFRSKELWDLLGENNIDCGVFNMPTTYPPKAMNGFMVSQNAPMDTKFTYPEWLEDELKLKFNYRSNPDYMFTLDRGTARRNSKQMINRRFDVAEYLMSKFNPRFCHLTLFYIDYIQHHFPQDVVEYAWTVIDDRIGALLHRFYDERTYVILMSDHGHIEKKCVFQIGKWLMERRLLTLNIPGQFSQSPSQNPGLGQDDVISTIGRMRVVRSLRPFVPAALRARLPRLMPPEIYILHPGQLECKEFIDWEQSTVIPVGHGSLYVNRKFVDSDQEYDDLRENLVRELEAITEPITGTKMAKRVYRREEIYSGRYLHNAPDIVILPNDGIFVASSPKSEDLWYYLEQDHGWRSVHKLHGIFLVIGPDIGEGLAIHDARIYDLAPTILHILGIPISREMDGRVLKEVFKKDSPMAKRAVEYQEVDEKARIKEKIGELRGGGSI